MVYFWSTKTHVEGTPLGFGTSASAGFYAHDKLIDIIPIKSSKYVNHFFGNDEALSKSGCSKSYSINHFLVLNRFNLD